MRKANIIITALVILGISTLVFGQAQHTDNKADQTLRGSGRVNPSTLGMEFEVPLGNYSGRGISVPIGLSYSSKVWRMDFRETAPKVGNGNQGCVSVWDAKFGENSASGWNSTMQEAYIEYTGYDNRFNGEGFPQNDPCYNSPPPNNPFGSYIRRIQIHLPSGESHELRLDDSVKIYNRNGCTTPDNPLCESNPELPENWNGMYYAADGSNLRYLEDRGNNVYKLLMTDGSYYEFSSAIGANATYNYKTIRKATRLVDRVGNTNTYHEPTALFPNGYWTDTLGRNLGVPLPRTEPSAPAIQTYTMPGLTGQNPVTYKFYWKKLKDTSATESALTDFNQNLKYLGDRVGAPYPNMPPSRPAESCLFHSDWENWAVHGQTLPIFNPVLLTAIELPTGQMYKFSYTISGEIDRIYYPTGGQERFEYSTIPALTQQEQPAQSVVEANRGVVNRKVYENATTQTPYQSTYSVMYVYPSGYKITTNNPDGTKSERFLFQGNQSNPDATQGDWGYDNGLAGMTYEERAYSSTGQLVNRKLSHWEISKLPLTFTLWFEPYGTGSFGNLGTWHPRVTQDESFIYDETGNGVSAVTKMEYEGNLNQIDTPVLPNKTSQYAFTALTVPTLNPNPDPNPTPVPMVSPPTLLRTSETQYLQSDPNILQLRKDVYKSINMVGLATSSVVKDAAGTIVSRSEMAYDETDYSPSIWHGNPTTSKVWDSTKGTVTTPSVFGYTREV
jgi:hypothetical protein